MSEFAPIISRSRECKLNYAGGMQQELSAVAWTGSGLRLLDQTRLPEKVEYLRIETVDQLVDAVVRLAVRGAPALGAVGAYGVALAIVQARREGWSPAERDDAVARIRDARPTAVNLAWALDKVRPAVGAGLTAVLAEADAIVEADVSGNRAIGRNGADWLEKRLADRPGLRVLTHCNTGSLATVGWGTALGVIRELSARGRLEVVYADETRPLLQGSRLTAWELAQEGIPHYVQADGAAASTILRGLVDVAIVGADRIAANGDAANKIGTVGIALACADAGIPMMVAAPMSTIDLATASGGEIEIELRADSEVLEWGGIRTAPRESRGYNPAFDVTPARLITALVTEERVHELTAGGRLV